LDGARALDRQAHGRGDARHGLVREQARPWRDVHRRPAERSTGRAGRQHEYRPRRCDVTSINVDVRASTTWSVLSAEEKTARHGSRGTLVRCGNAVTAV